MTGEDVELSAGLDMPISYRVFVLSYQIDLSKFNLFIWSIGIYVCCLIGDGGTQISSFYCFISTKDVSHLSGLCSKVFSFLNLDQSYLYLHFADLIDC